MVSQIIFMTGVAVLPTPEFLSLMNRLFSLPGLLAGDDGGEFVHEHQEYAWFIDRHKNSVVLTVERL